MGPPYHFKNGNPAGGANSSIFVTSVNDSAKIAPPTAPSDPVPIATLERRMLSQIFIRESFENGNNNRSFSLKKIIDLHSLFWSCEEEIQVKRSNKY